MGLKRIFTTHTSRHSNEYVNAHCVMEYYRKVDNQAGERAGAANGFLLGSQWSAMPTT